MAGRSVANGAYRILLYLQSASRQADWYRVAQDRHSRALSCDCPQWTFNRAERTCKHTRFVDALLGPGARAVATGVVSASPAARPLTDARAEPTATISPIVAAINAQYPGFLGDWETAERRGWLDGAPYHVIQVRFRSDDGVVVEATLAFAEAHRASQHEMLGEVAVRAGYCIALELAHRRGVDLAIRPPSHYSVTSGRGQSRRAPARTPTPATSRELPSIQLDHILRIAGAPAAGRTPAERAEGTLRLMLGDDTYAQLLSDGYLDVPSARFADRKRVYRLRRDPMRNDDKRVRIFEEVDGRMMYVNDYCIIRQSHAIPEADHYTTKWLGLLSGEERIIGVVGRGNIFQPHSDDWDGRVEETVLPVWRDPRPALAA